MQVTVVRPGDLGPSEAELWARFQHSSPRALNPFLSLTFARAVGRARPNARVAVVDDGGTIEAFLPFELAARRMAVPIGSPMNDLQDFVGSGAPIDARSVVRKAGLRSWRFLHVPAQQPAFAPYHYRGTLVQSQLINLKDGSQSYFNSRSKSATRRTTEKRRRSLERQHGAVSLEWDSPYPRHLQQLISWKSGKYGGARRLFSDPSALRIVEELAASDHEDCRGIISVLFAGERPVANVLGLIAPWALSVWFSSYDPDLSHFSPGMIMWDRLVDEAGNKGITRIDFGAGQDIYKFSLANDAYPVAGGAVWASRAEETARRIYRRIRQPASH
jgi:CelD/BcsL family acetyltransferase involved in cellulose biosynthesis